MLTNLKPDNCLDVALPVSVTSSNDKTFEKINTESLNKTKMNFLADMSHEIRTPLGAIIGLGQILMLTNLDDKQRQCVTILQSSAEALLVMVNRILDISKIESGAAVQETAPFNMAVLLEQIVAMMSIKAQEKNIGLTLNYETEAPKTFIGDSGRIQQIVVNLVGNAIKFTAAGAIVVSFTTSRDEISISVADTGIGMTQDKLEVIFDRFVQADSTISRKYGGTGLGLSISKALAENMGGAITANSVAGQGSVFSLHLKLPTAAGDRDNVIYLDTVMNATEPSLM